MEKVIYTRKEICNLLGVHKFTVRRYEREGLIKPAFYIRNRPRYTIDSLTDKLIKERNITNI